MSQRLASGLLEASEGRGGAMNKRDEVHRMSEANKAVSHFRFETDDFACRTQVAGMQMPATLC